MIATTTAWGNATPLDETLKRIAENTDSTIVELSIGALPVEDPLPLIGEWGERFEFIGHHAFPGGPGKMLRPSDDLELVRWLKAWGVTRYSAHPPSLKHAGVEEMYKWALDMRFALAIHGIEFAVETMYEPRTQAEVAASHGYHLAGPAEVWEFVEIAYRNDWHRPLVIDASHLHIGFHGGTWTESDIEELLVANVADELHVSFNDGRRDQHKPLAPEAIHVINHWVAPHLSDFSLVVDEGRRPLAQLPTWETV